MCVLDFASDYWDLAESQSARTSRR
jgi:hypothetical protein